MSRRTEDPEEVIRLEDVGGLNVKSTSLLLGNTISDKERSSGDELVGTACGVVSSSTARTGVVKRCTGCSSEGAYTPLMVGRGGTEEVKLSSSSSSDEVHSSRSRHFVTEGIRDCARRMLLEVVGPASEANSQEKKNLSVHVQSKE